ncbi:aminopeptidase [Halanaeroarchaeum sulfurireducens]|uniref:Peptidase M29 aminopeptidase II n=1 Tax=Halanaeroarchaeum sulfurireducens TaxID=1604004 RepID=A0A0F7PCY6_9EURY|nr:aminopeptidase [Halanaeroarchaeum sulfurireducens]AKH98587.1 peptidase M29 aminopeptidase II [Halanaeroarchaeum sulfurireducens]ALG83029.1 peptidase M29 aminopeptidase II [Halanaeroarchaeum sulfurireducens]
MDPRIRRHADVLVDHSTAIEPGDRVVVSVPPAAEDLAVAIYERLGEIGARPVMLFGGTTIGSSRAARGYLRSSGADELPDLDHIERLYDETDAIIRARARENATELGDVDPATNAALSRAAEAARAEMLDSRWVLTQFPTPADAQLAGMSTEAYENFVWDAIDQDWEAQRAFQEQLVDRLNEGETVRIVSGETTDVTMSIAGNIAINDYGRNNMPAGEVFTAPVVDSVEGTVLFDKPLYHQGREVENAFLEFEGGEVVDHAADTNEETLGEVLDTDEGSRHLGELGIGTNRDIDRFTYNMLFDEKMGDTVHMAVGMAYDECVGDDNAVNESATHVDMIVDMAEHSRIEVDGEVIQRNGTFWFEDGFEG